MVKVKLVRFFVLFHFNELIYFMYKDFLHNTSEFMFYQKFYILNKLRLPSGMLVEMLYKSRNQTVVSKWTKICVVLTKKNAGRGMRKQNLFYYLRAFALQRHPGGIPGARQSGMSDCDTTKTMQLLIHRT